MDFTPKDFALAVAVVLSIFCLIAMVIQYIQNVDYKQRVNEAFNNIRHRVSVAETGINGNAGSIVSLQSSLENLRQEMQTTFSADTPVTVDWEELTKKLRDENLASTYVPNNQQEHEAALRAQYQQVKSAADHVIDHRKTKAKDETNRLAAKYPHYYVNVEGLTFIDFYRIAQLYNITDPCIQHVVKKLLATGNRGHKKFRHDIEDAVDTLKARLRMLDEDGVE